MKVRIERTLLARARVCSDAVGAPLSEWAGRALKRLRAGTLARVATSENIRSATRAGSVVATLPGCPADADDMRAALESAVAFCESRRLPDFKTPHVEGRDYLVEPA